MGFEMSTYKVILFDLDGTLSDPKVGITKSVQYALGKMGIIEPDIDKLDCFIGPPLQVSFAEYYDLDDVNSHQAIEYYRERFKDQGMFENEIYAGISALLEILTNESIKLVVATSKPTVFAEEILKYFQIDQFFELVVGSNLDGSRSAKTEIIQYILDSYKGYKKEEFIMIGDRKHDIIGANNTGIASIGVTYGYGSEGELQDANATYIVRSVSELNSFFV